MQSLLMFVFFAFNFVKVSAAGTTETITLGGTSSEVNVVINGTKYNKYTDRDNSDVLDAVELIGYTDTNGNTPLTFIQSNGNSKEVEIHFTIENFPSGATEFMIVESQYSDSSSNPDADRYNFDKLDKETSYIIVIKDGDKTYAARLPIFNNPCETDSDGDGIVDALEIELSK